jgi:hypothetical protein
VDAITTEQPERKAQKALLLVRVLLRVRVHVRVRGRVRSSARVRLRYHTAVLRGQAGCKVDVIPPHAAQSTLAYVDVNHQKQACLIYQFNTKRLEIAPGFGSFIVTRMYDFKVWRFPLALALSIENGR